MGASRIIRVAMVAALCLSAWPTFAQNPAMIPQGLQREPRNADEAAYRNAQINRAIEDDSRQRLRDAERAARESAVPPGDLPKRMTGSERKRLLELLSPRADDRERYKTILAQPRTGIFKLYPDADCISRAVVRVDGPCAEHIPEGSTSAFRDDSLTPDIHFNHGQLVGTGFFSQTIMVDLGDMPIESVGLASPGVRYLSSFQPARTVAGAAEQYGEIVKGITADGYKFTLSTPVKADNTYAMRIVAYRNTTYRGFRLRPPADLSADHFRFGLLYRDNRKDLIVAFRIVRKADDGSVTIVWRELDRRKSPELKFGKKEELLDFRKSSFRGEAFVLRD
jgi:hypothetical protein